MKLLIVIVNYKTPALAIDCLRSLEPQIRAMNEQAKVALTDNLSPDDSVSQFRSAIETNGWQMWIDLMPLPSNGGFAWGNNEGIAPYLKSDDPPQYVLLLNPDTVVHDGAIAELVNYMDANPKVGIAGSRMEWPDGSAQSSAFRFPGVMSELEGSLRLGFMSKLLKRFIVAPPPPTKIEPAEWVVGASMMIRAEVFDSIGLMDAKYFMYFEEVDFCLRARRAGWPCMYVPSSRVTHFIGQASGVTDKAKARRRRPDYWFDSRRRYFVKNHGLIYAAFADLAFIVGFSLWRLRRAIQRKEDADPEHFLGDFVRHSVFLRGGK